MPVERSWRGWECERGFKVDGARGRGDEWTSVGIGHSIYIVEHKYDGIALDQT